MSVVSEFHYTAGGPPVKPDVRVHADGSVCVSINPDHYQRVKVYGPAGGGFVWMRNEPCRLDHAAIYPIEPEADASAQHAAVLLFGPEGPVKHRCDLPDVEGVALETLGYCEGCRRWYVLDRGNDYGQPQWSRLTWLDRALSPTLRRRIASHTTMSSAG